jgi:hypothetical protein
MLKKLYKIALAEKQGLGSAYEYYAKIRLLKRLLRDFRPKTVLVYGLPERYGYSLDFFWLFRGSKIYVYEDRIVKLNECLELTSKIGLKQPEVIKKVHTHFDLIVSSEAFQRMEKERYVAEVLKYGKMAAIFVPNKDNSSHRRISGLKGFSLHELQEMFQSCGGYIDMPPFPPGMRKKGKPTWLHFLILWFWAQIEWLLPLKMRHAHICYIFMPASSR